MINTEFNISALCGVLSSDASFQTLRDMIDELGLEIEDVRTL